MRLVAFLLVHTDDILADSVCSIMLLPMHSHPKLGSTYPQKVSCTAAVSPFCCSVTWLVNCVRALCTVATLRYTSATGK